MRPRTSRPEKTKRLWWTPFNEAEIDLVLDQQVLARSRNATTPPAAPRALHLLSAIGEKSAGAAAEVGPTAKWTAPVGAAGNVTYTVQTSDDGNVWNTIAIGLKEPSLTLTPDQASAPMIRVIASNGFRRAAPVTLQLRK
jgi:hypothetical protein